MHWIEPVEEVFHLPSARPVIQKNRNRGDRCGHFPGYGDGTADTLHEALMAQQVKDCDQEHTLVIVIGVDPEGGVHPGDEYERPQPVQKAVR